MRLPILSSTMATFRSAAASGRLSRLGFGVLITFILASTAYRFRPAEPVVQEPPSVPVTDTVENNTQTPTPDPAVSVPPPTPVTSPAPAPGPGLVGSQSPTSPDPPPPPAPPRIVKNDTYYTQRQKERAAALNRYDQLFRMLNGGNP